MSVELECWPAGYFWRNSLKCQGVNAVRSLLIFFTYFSAHFLLQFWPGLICSFRSFSCCCRKRTAGIWDLFIAGDHQRPNPASASRGSEGGAERPEWPGVLHPAVCHTQTHQGAFQQQLITQLHLRDGQRVHFIQHTWSSTPRPPEGEDSQLSSSTHEFLF